LANLIAATNFDAGDKSESEGDEIDSTLNPLLYDFRKEIGSNDKDLNELTDDGEAVYKQKDTQTEVKLKTELKRKRVLSDTSPPKSGTPTIVVDKSRRISVHHTAAELAKEGMLALGESMKAAMVPLAELPEITRFDQSLPILSLMRKERTLSSEEYLRYSKLLRKDGMLAAMFVGMDEDLRKEWLETEYLSL
jgi:hypothetical protein